MLIICIDISPPIILQFFDKDEAILDFNGDDYLGVSVINLNDSSVIDHSGCKDISIYNSIPEPKWHDIK